MGLRSDDLVLRPEQLRLLCGVFDDAWEECRPDYDGSETSTEVGRLRLANAVLSARRGVSDVAMIKAVALRRTAMWRHESRFAL